VIADFLVSTLLGSGFNISLFSSLKSGDKNVFSISLTLRRIRGMLISPSFIFGIFRVIAKYCLITLRSENKE
jgi:hypothetical protein